MNIKNLPSTVTSNLIGAGLGAVAFYLGAKKVAKVENKYYVIGLVVVGAIVGAVAQSKIKSKNTIKPAIQAVK